MSIIQVNGFAAPSLPASMPRKRQIAIADIAARLRAQGVKNALFGYIGAGSDAVLVAASPRYDRCAGCLELCLYYTGKQWQPAPPAIATMIIAAEEAGTVRLENWRKPRPTATYEKRKEAARWASLQSNRGGYARKHKGQPNRRGLPPTGSEYERASRRIYGHAVEMNGKRVPVRGGICEYLDGKTPEGYRPLAPQFPVKSGKR